MKKFMRIALVFALAGAALVGCTKDYSGDISDLNKEVSAIQSTLTSLQTSIQGAQSAADAAASTANTALSAAKAAATADDLKAVQTALAAAATSADLTKVDAKYAAFIPAIEAAAKASDLEALETAITAAIAATDVKVADLEKALEEYAKKADLDEAVTKLGELETNYIALEARVAKLEAADVEIQKLIDANAKGIKTNAEAIEALQELVEELTAQIDGLVSIEAPAPAVAVVFDYAQWNPNTGDATYKAIAAKFPEIKDIKKDTRVVQGGHVPFVVNPASVKFDDSYAFAFVDINGNEYPGTLSNPVEGLEGAVKFNDNGVLETKAGNAFWTLTLAPTWNKTAEKFAEGKNYSLVVNDGENTTNTQFVYEIAKKKVEENAKIIFTTHPIVYAPEIDLFGKVAFNATEKKYVEAVTFANEMTGKFILEAEPSAANALLIEEYGVTFDGSKVLIANYPANKTSISFKVKFTVLGLNGIAVTDWRDIKVNKAISADGVLAAKEVVLKGTATTEPYKVRWNISDYDFSKAELAAFVTADHSMEATRTYTDANGAQQKQKLNCGAISFFDKNGTLINDKANNWDKAVTFGFNITSDGYFAPEQYNVLFKVTTGNGDDETTIYAAESTITFSNDAEVVKGAVKLLDAVCDADGTLLAVGSADGTTVTYDFAQAFVVKTTVAEITGYKDLEYNEDADHPTVANYEWISKVNFGTAGNIDERDGLKIMANGQQDKYLAKYNYVNNTTRNIRANIKYFGNQFNLGTVDFKVKVISPIYSETGASLAITNASIDFGKSVELSTILGTEGTYVVGPNTGKKFQLLKTWKKSDDTPATYTYYTDDYSAPNLSAAGDTRPEYSDEDAFYAMGSAVYSASQYVFDENDDPIVFDTFEKDYLKFFKSDIKTSEIQAINEYLNSKDFKPLYLTNMMFQKFAKVWAKYYDADGTPLTGLTKDNKTVYWWSYEHTLTPDQERGYEEWKAAIGTSNLAAFPLTEEQRTIVCAPLEADEVAIALFNEYKEAVKKLVTKAVPGSDDIPDKGRSTDVKKVTVKFDDPDVAAKFVSVDPANGFENPYESGTSVKLKANANYSPADLNGKTSVDVTGTVEVLDAWGLTTKKAFKVTCKIPTR